MSPRDGIRASVIVGQHFLEYQRLLDYPEFAMLNRAILLSLLMLLPAWAQAALYHWIDAEGRAFYSDRPPPSGEAVEVRSEARRPDQDASTTTPPDDGQSSAAESQAAQAQAVLGPYTSFEIITPEPDQTLIENQGELAVSLLLDPGLGEGQRLVMQVDGKAVAIEGGATQFMLKGLSLGSHRIQAQVLDAGGALVARTAAQRVHLRPLPPPGPGVLR